MSMYSKPFMVRVRAGLPVDFSDTLAFIDKYYEYNPTRFSNGLGAETLVNESGQNEGSCRIFYFARLHGLTESETLNLFGHHYRIDVLSRPEGQNHANIRTFMKYGWMGVHHDDGDPPCLVLRTTPLSNE